MMNNSTTRSVCILSRWAVLGMLAAATLWGCAPIQPLPFDLVDKGRVFHGTLSPTDRRVEVDIGGKHFQGYYLLAAGTAYFQGGSWRRPYANDVSTSFVSNSARATMVADDGERFTCEFIVEDNSAIGECKSTTGQTYQLVTQSR
ncbi:MAG: hypothetical protein NT159_13875 [Proteobacteria bacterium]|nr:hypothetical protein [Pseudomonadota bacterium]